MADNSHGMFARVRQFLAGGVALAGALAMTGADSPQPTGPEEYIQSLEGEQEIVLTEHDTPQGLVDGENDIAVAKGENPETGKDGYWLAYKNPSGSLDAAFSDELYIGDMSENGLKDYQFVVKGDRYSTPVHRVNEGYLAANKIPNPVVKRLNMYTFDDYLDGQEIKQPENTDKQVSGR